MRHCPPLKTKQKQRLLCRLTEECATSWLSALIARHAVIFFLPRQPCFAKNRKQTNKHMLLPCCGAFEPAEVLYACSPVTTAAHSTFSKFSWPGCCGRGRAPQLARALLLLRSKACVLGQLLWTVFCGPLLALVTGTLIS